MLNQQEKDKKLLELIKKHPNRGMNLLMNEYGGLVFFVVQKRIPDNINDIEECVSDVFIDFYSNINAVDLNKGSIKAFLITIATRRAIDTYRRNSVHREVYSLDDEDSYIEYMLLKENNNPEELAIQKNDEDRLLQAVKDLGEPDSQILYRRYFMQQSVKEIAETLGMKSNSVSKRITRALSVLEERLGGIWS